MILRPRLLHHNIIRSQKFRNISVEQYSKKNWISQFKIKEAQFVLLCYLQFFGIFADKCRQIFTYINLITVIMELIELSDLLLILHVSFCLEKGENVRCSFGKLFSD